VKRTLREPWRGVRLKLLGKPRHGLQPVVVDGEIEGGSVGAAEAKGAIDRSKELLALIKKKI